VNAHFDRGVLEVRIPKPEQRKPRKVAISVGGTTGGAEEAPPTIDAAQNGSASELAGSAA